MQDQHRRIIKQLQRHAPGLKAVPVREDGHAIVDFSYAGKTARITMSGSPKTVEYAIRRACKDVCKALDLPKMRR